MAKRAIIQYQYTIRVYEPSEGIKVRSRSLRTKSRNYSPSTVPLITFNASIPSIVLADITISLLASVPCKIFVAFFEDINRISSKHLYNRVLSILQTLTCGLYRDTSIANCSRSFVTLLCHNLHFFWWVEFRNTMKRQLQQKWSFRCMLPLWTYAYKYFTLWQLRQRSNVLVIILEKVVFVVCFV